MYTIGVCSRKGADYTDFASAWSARLSVFFRPKMFLVETKQHRARERPFQRRERVEQSERQPPRRAQHQRVVAERAEQSVRERDARPAVGAPPPRVRREALARANLIARHRKQLLRQLPGIAHA